MKKQKKRLPSFVITYVYKDGSESIPFKRCGSPIRIRRVAQTEARSLGTDSRAIENRAYVLALNRSGSDFNKIFAEQSLILDP
ncbi:hypothetical protein ACFWMS_07600 [Peribacillus butanolivorans]|uniref:hypothetical protein n=1 Tax=Peribacillus butanolivorans TaxID=421767 RepID=UPI003669338D